MSDNELVEQGTFRTLEALVHSLADELAAFRRRALSAEARVKEVESVAGGATSLDLSKRVAQLEQENERLQTRVDAAASRATQILDRVRFLRQQTQGGAGAAGGGGKR